MRRAGTGSTCDAGLNGAIRARIHGLDERIVEQVERLAAEFKIVALVDGESLRHAQVYIGIAG